jgi:hypothetical protein
MASIDKEIKALDEGTFESLVHQILLAKYPGAGIKKVEGTGGDEGIDSFEGKLANGPAVWQCKHFSRLGRSQKSKILQSIATAFAHRSLGSWTLCIPVDLRTTEHEWFQNAIVTPYSNSARISLLQNSDLIQAIIDNPNILRAFFPEIGISSIIKLQDQLIAGATPATDREVLQLQVERHLREMRSLDPRLLTTLVISEAGSFQGPPPPDSVFTIRQAGSTLYLSAKDRAALALHPIVFTFRFREEVSRKSSTHSTQASHSDWRPVHLSE